MTIVAPLGMHCPLPMELVTKFTVSGFAYLGAGATTVNINFNLNGCYHPLASASSVTWGTGITIATFQCPGFPSLCSTTMYQSFVVRKALFEFDVTPQSVVDSVIFTGTPSQAAGTPGTVNAALTRPWTKQMGFAAGRTNRRGEYPFRHTVELAKYLGIPRLLYDNDQSGNFVGSDTSNPPATFPYVVNIATGDAAGLSQALELRVRITYFVLLRQLNTDVLL